MQVVLLTISCTYFAIGSILEYVRRSELIIAGFALVFGSLKFGVGIFFVVQDLSSDDPEKWGDIEKVELNESITHLLVAFRFSLVTIFVIGLAKWFTRQQL